MMKIELNREERKIDKGDIVLFTKDDSEFIYMLTECNSNRTIAGIDLLRGEQKYSISNDRSYEELIDHIFGCGDYDGYQLYASDSVKLVMNKI